MEAVNAIHNFGTFNQIYSDFAITPLIEDATWREANHQFSASCMIGESRRTFDRVWEL